MTSSYSQPNAMDMRKERLYAGGVRDHQPQSPVLKDGKELSKDRNLRRETCHWDLPLLVFTQYIEI